MKEFLLIVLLGAAGIWKSIPVGFIMKMDPYSIALATVIGAVVAVMILFILGSRVKRWAVGKMNQGGMQKKSRRMTRIFDRYGALGIGILGTFLIGPNLSMVIGLTIVKAEKQLLLAVLAGIVIWTIVLTALTSAGIDVVQQFGV